MPEPKKLRDLGASVRARLLRMAQEKGYSFELLLTRYAIERLLYRLSLSEHRDRFVLKGAMLMTSWFDDPHRPTRDVDFLGFGDNAPEAMLATFRDICAVPADDGIQFDPITMRVERIREELAYGGVRLRTIGQLAGARITVIIDIGFGDAVEPGIEDIDLPVLLGLPQPRLRAYARETVIAEKFQAMVLLGLANSRMKNFYDVWVLSRSHSFNEDRLARAIAATFERRGTAIPISAPVALTQDFANDIGKQQQWTAFVRNLTAEVPPLSQVVTDLESFLMPCAHHARQGATNVQAKTLSV